MALLDVQHLSIDYVRDDGILLHAVDDVSFAVEKGRSLALVGESGCGKTTTMLALLRLLPAEGRITGGKILCNGVDLLRLSEAEIRRYRWHQVAMIFQGAMNALNPVRKVGDQIAEVVTLHMNADRRTAKARVGELMEMVGIQPERANQYPHQFSGGMRQRAMIAMALACNPDVLIADEPTTALDVMIQAQILDLLQNLQSQLGLSVVLVTHDLGVVAELCDDVLIMYGGKVAEYGDVDTIFNQPQHPYTQRLLEAFPDVNAPTATLASIPGYPPPLNNLPPGCRFEPRCHGRTELCAQVVPPLRQLRDVTQGSLGHLAACHYAKPEETAVGQGLNYDS